MKYFQKVFFILVIAVVLAAVFVYLYFPGFIPVFGKHETRPTFVVDPGHGGADGGAVAADGTLEKDLNLQIANSLTQLLVFYGHNTVQTRDCDAIDYPNSAKTIRQKKVYDTKNRVRFTEEKQNPVFVSLHLNTYPNPQYFGPQVFFSKNNPEGRELAGQIQQSLKTTGLDRGRVIKQAPKGVYLMDNLHCPAVIVECGFLTNPAELELLKQPAHHKELAIAVFMAAREYEARLLTNVTFE